MASASHVTIRKRVAVFFLMVTFVIVGLICRLGYLQFYRSTWLAENATDQRVREIPVEAKRGIIYDRLGRELAISVSAESVYAIPAEIRNPEETAAKLAAILALDPNNLAVKLKKRQAFTWVKRKLDAETARQVKVLNLPGIGLTQESQRHYPQDNLAAHILGFTGVDSQGLDGVEMTFDSYLRGRSGSIVVEYDARGREIPHANHRYVPPVDGQNIYLTIDLVIQQIIERELDRIMKETQARAATIIIMQPQTGEILALANKPDYNPNRFAEFAPKLWRNNAVSNAYEPGSTFKIITTAAALGERVVKLEDRFFDPGSIEVQGRNIHCWKHGGHGSQSFVEVVQNSCNVGFVTVGLRLGTDPFYQYIDKFGFGKHTGIDLPGEAKGIMIDKAKVKPINIATMSIGQSIAVTPIQLVNAVSAVANDGKLNRPQIVREVKDKNGQLIREFQPDVVRQVLEEAVAKQEKGVLEKVVEEGSGKGAAVEGYRVAGKTGTAQKVGAGGYLPDKYVASFVGFAPADNPQVAMLVIIDEPVGLYYGGQIAAPVFGAVMKDVLPYIKLTPQIQVAAKDGKEMHTEVPQVINLPVSEASKLLQKAGLTVRLEEAGERVTDQIPKPGSRVPKGTNVLLYTDNSRYLSGEVTVPDCLGLSLTDAANVLTDVGLMINPAGTGNTIVRQEPPPGSKAMPGVSIHVFFE
ncbi:stage V sporulation protein D [Anaerospora sp.]|jgi:stage V sporulation protein D (sporulation-specific penicillin-binding protein)|uniref:stage V sporulation protein D n=1 Tax=Anaerospora sp. TaxID=1960278 RepID=UPI002899C7BC|nr:stage V sporulation protein D [Anaerospora sp.]MDF2928038.1 spoVD 5 [Anaerospora sp.]